MAINSFNVISNNVKGLQSTKKRLKLIQYLKDKINKSGIVFFQETHSDVDNESKWKENFQGNLLYSFDSSVSCGVLIDFFGFESNEIKNKLCDANGGILILNVIINDERFIIVKLYNSSTEIEQIKTISNFSHLLHLLDVTINYKTIFTGHFNLLLNSKLDSDGGNPTIKL